MVIYRLPNTAGFFEDLNNLLITLNALGFTAAVHAAGRIPIHNPGDYATVECLLLNKRVKPPLVGPLQVALSNEKPDLIEITVLEGRDQEKGYSHSPGGFASVLDAMFQPFLLNYYERHLDSIKSQHGDADNGWPPSWRMGWLVRNAISHNGCVYFKSPNHPAVRWQGHVVGPSDNGKPVLSRMLNVGDLMILLLEMEETRVGAPLPRA